MEAATPLRKSSVTAVNGAVHIVDLVIEDETAARVVRERAEAGADPATTVADAVEIGARVLDREQAAANADFVRAEFEKVAKDVEVEFGEKARAVAEFFNGKVDEVFGEENGRLAKELDRLFSDSSSGAVQHRVRELVAEVMAKSREDLVRQFSAADASNPLADFKAGTLHQLKQAEARSHTTQTALLERMGQLEQQLQALRLEKEKLEEVAEERERGTAKGRTYEEAVADAIDVIAVGQGDVAEPVGDERGAGGRKGDVLVALDAAHGPARGAIVFEAKDSRLSKPQFREQLEGAIRQRDADYAVLVVPSAEEVPAKLHPLREYDGDKLVVVYDPEGGSPLELEFAYRLARARVAIAREGGEGIDTSAIRATVSRGLAALDDVRKVKLQLTTAEGGIENAREILEVMAERARTEFAQIDALAAGGGDAQAELGL
jgi:hypothetical protein